MNSLIGKKTEQVQNFLENGIRIPVTRVTTGKNLVVAVKNMDKDHYTAVQLGFGIKKNANKAKLGHAKKAGQEKAPLFLKEVRIIDADGGTLPELGSFLKPMDVFKPGDMVDVSGRSKGKGFAGGVKRYGFHGGPKTHGQSDRHRGPGAVGSGTTPGRVYKGKRMAGNMGHENVTIKNLLIVDVDEENLYIKGLVPGYVNSMVVVKKIGEHKKFVPLYKEVDETKMDEGGSHQSVSDDAQQVVEEPVSAPEAVTEETAPAVEEPKTEKPEEKEAADVQNSGEPQEVKEDAK